MEHAYYTDLQALPTKCARSKPANTTAAASLCARTIVYVRGWACVCAANDALGIIIVGVACVQPHELVALSIAPVGLGLRV